MTTRRSALAASLACGMGALVGAEGEGKRPAAGGPARAEGPRDLELVDLRLGPGETPFGGRVPVLSPRHIAPGARAPLVVALHGLGESGDPPLAARAWPDLYGLVEAYRRLLAPPIAPRSRRGDWPAARMEEVSRELASRPLGGFFVACPFTPNPARARDRSAHLDAYARWIVDVVVPRAREQLPVIATPQATHLAGCSMGGSVALDVALRARGAFCGLALVQSAHSAHRNAEFAAALATAGAGGKSVAALVLTSQGDPFRERNEALARELATRKVPHEARVLPGPHDQPWLREAGTPEMLLWLDRRPRA